MRSEEGHSQTCIPIGLTHLLEAPSSDNGPGSQRCAKPGRRLPASIPPTPGGQLVEHRLETGNPVSLRLPCS